MPQLRCPHCQHLIALNEQFHSAVVVVDEGGVVASYHPNPDKTYVTSEKSRKASLGYYYQNRERVLAKYREQRRQKRAGKVAP